MTHYEPGEHERLVAEELRAHRLAEPSTALQNRVMTAAQTAWKENTEPAHAGEMVPWTMPVFRLAASFAVAAMLMALAHRADRALIATWRPIGPAPQQADHTGELHAEWQAYFPMSKLAGLSAATTGRRAAEHLARYRQ